MLTRFDPQSELMQLSTQIGEAVPVSDLLYEAVQFAVAVAEESEGAFDRTVGHSMEARGFNREIAQARALYEARGTRPISSAGRRQLSRRRPQS